MAQLHVRGYSLCSGYFKFCFFYIVHSCHDWVYYSVINSLPCGAIFFKASPPRQYYNLLPSSRDLWRKGGTRLGLAWYCSIGLVVLEAHKKGGFLSKKGGGGGKVYGAEE